LHHDNSLHNSSNTYFTQTLCEVNEMVLYMYTFMRLFENRES